MIICAKCGFENNDNVKNCANCLTDLHWAKVNLGKFQGIPNDTRKIGIESRRARGLPVPNDESTPLEPIQIAKTPIHSMRGIVSFLLPSATFCGVISNYPSFAFMGSPTGSLFLYCIFPVLLLTGLILSIVELRNKDSKKLFPTLGIIVTLLAAAPMLLEWLLGLMQGVPFSCLENPTFCGW